MAALVVVVTVSLLAGCGDDDGDPESGFDRTRAAEDDATDELDRPLPETRIPPGDDPFGLPGDGPSGFPEEITLPERGRLVFAVSDPATESWTLVYADLDEHDVAAFRDSLVGDGFDIRTTAPEPEGGSAGFIAAGHGYDLVVGGSPDGLLISVMEKA